MCPRGRADALDESAVAHARDSITYSERDTIPYSERDSISYVGGERNTIPHRTGDGRRAHVRNSITYGRDTISYSMRESVERGVEERNSTPYNAESGGSGGVRRSDARARPRRGKVNLYFANVTSWSHKALDYLVTEGTPMATADVAAIVEHHKRGEALTAAIKRLHKLGWRVTAQACADTGVAVHRAGQGHGGVWIQTRAHLQQRGLTVEAKNAIQLDEHKGLETQWTARTVRMCGHDIIFAVVYLAPGEGLQGANYATLQEVGIYLRVMGPHLYSLGILI
jgi:hypothetical protein